MIDGSCIRRSISLRKELIRKSAERRLTNACKADTIRHISTVRSILYRTASRLRTSPIQGRRKVKYIEQLKNKKGELTLTELLEILIYLKVHSKTKNLELIIKEHKDIFCYDDYTEVILINSIKYLDSFKKSERVSLILEYLAKELELRGDLHDKSKLEEPELEAFAKVNHKAKDTVYDSEEYKKNLQTVLKKALEHHYSENSHHPEYYGEKGVKGMDLIDIIEMIADWKASTFKYKEGDILKGIEINQSRFKYSDGLKSIFITTAKKFYRFQIQWVNIDGSKGYYRADTLEDIYTYLSLNVPRLRKRDLKFLRDTLLKGVVRLELDGFLKYRIDSNDYGDLSAYSQA